MSAQEYISGTSARISPETSDRKPRVIGLIVLTFTFGIFGVWATFAPLNSAALAPGVVVVKGKRKTVQHLEGGIVREILVEDGDQIKEGQPLLILDSTQFSAESEVLQGEYYRIKARERRLIAERDDRGSVQFSPNFINGDDRSLAARENEVAIFKARKKAREGKREVLEKKINQLESRIRGMEASAVSKKELVKSFQKEITDLEELLEEGFVGKTRLVELMRNLVRTRGEIEENKASMAEAKVRIGETRLKILQNEKDFKMEVVGQLAETQSQVFGLKERIAAIQDKVRRTVVRAPVSGRVLGMKTHTIGGVIQGGTPVLDVVPGTQDFIIEARVKPEDIDQVQVGAEADIRLTAFQRNVTPRVKGVVTKVSADRLEDRDSNTPFYRAIIEVTEEGIKRLSQQQLKMVAGMPAEVLIKTGERTLLEYLVQPAEDALAKSLNEE